MGKTSAGEFHFSAGVLFGIFFYFGFIHQLWDFFIILFALAFFLIGLYKIRRAGDKRK